MDKRYRLDYAVLAQRIKLARKEKGLSQERLAEAVGISTNMIGKLEISYTTASLKTVLAIANVLDVDINYLLATDGVGQRQAADIFIESQLRDFSERDKELLIQIMSAIKTYKNNS